RGNHMVSGGDLDPFLPGKIPCDTDQSSHVPEFEGEVAFPVGPPPRLPQDLFHGALVEVGDLPVVLDLLGDEPDELLPVFRGIRHALAHVDLVPVPPDTGTERRVHPLDGIQVSCRDHDEPAEYRFGPDHRPARTLALAGDGELTFLEGGEEVLLGMGSEGIDLIDEEYTL